MKPHTLRKDWPAASYAERRSPPHAPLQEASPQQQFAESAALALEPVRPDINAADVGFGPRRI